MTTTPGNASSDLPGKPPIVDLATWQAVRDELLIREKAHTHEGDAIAAAQRRLPMVEIDGTAEVTGARRSRSVPRPVPGPRRARRVPAHVVRRRTAPGPVRGLHHHGLASTPPHPGPYL